MFGETNEGRSIFMKRSLVLVLVALVVGAAFVGAQEGPPPPPPPPEGLTFSGSVSTGLRYQSYAGGKEHQFDIYSFDDLLANADTVALRGALNKGSYGANFGLSLNANNTIDGFLNLDRIYVSEASLWTNALNNKLRVKGGYFMDFDYITTITASSLGYSNALALTVFPIQGLQIDVRTKNSPANKTDIWRLPTWYTGEQWARNIDGGVKYVNPNFTVFVGLDDDYTAPDGFMRFHEYQTDIFANFAWTGTPKLTASIEGRLYDLTTERTNPVVVDSITGTSTGGDDVGMTIASGLVFGYQITDALFTRAWIYLGAAPLGGPGIVVKQLLGEDGFSVGVNAEVSYKINDAFTVSLTPIFQILDTENADIFDLSVKPKVVWNIAAGPYASSIHLSYKLNVYGEGGGAYVSNNNEALHHTVGLSFGCNF
jgi:hypothetical protein